MSKVLFVSNFKDGTGWSHGAIDYALALDSVGVDVVLRNLKLGKGQGSPPPRILELMQKSAVGCDVCIQMVLPHMLEYHGGFRKNIAIYFTETDSIRYTDWPDHINQMDEVWAPCQQIKDTSINSGVAIPVHVVHYPCDVQRFSRSYKPLKLREELGDSFLFYTIGEMNKRKNLEATLKAFHLEFSPNEPVELLIKTTGDKEDVIRYCSQVKEGMKLYPRLTDYKQEMILTDYLSEDEMMRLHVTGDCFVGPSYGEGWGIPAFEAMAMGKTPIVSDWGAFRDYLYHGYNGWTVKGRLEPVSGMHASCPIPNLYSSRERWFSVDITNLRYAMRDAYSNPEIRESIGLDGMKSAHDFSYFNIGQRMKGLLA